MTTTHAEPTMSRHRNIRKLDYSEEYDYDDVYGRSLEDEVAVSPSTAAEFLYHRETHESPSLKTYFDERGGQGETVVQRSLSEPFESKPRPKLKDSPLASSSSSAVTRKSEMTSVIGPPPGFQPLFSSPVTVRTEDTSSKPHTKGASSSTVKKISRNTAAPKMGFVTTGILEDDHCHGTYRSHSGTPSPSQSPYRSPARSPSPSLTDSNPLLQATRHPPPSQKTSKSKFLNVDVISQYKQRQKSSKGHINLVVIGHVDAGKSTLMGHLLYLLGNVSKKAMHKYELESQKVGKSSFAYAWVLDETGEERHRGITMDIAQRVFETPSKIINLLDAPGHKDFIPNMITGAAQADVAVMVVNATVGEFEAGFEAGGQTREHALLVRSLGVRQMTVAVNKMDTVEWSEVRFDEVMQKMKAFLKQAGFKESDVSYVPCSGLTGENLVKSSTAKELTVWYTGPTLLETIDKFVPPPRPVDKAFRCCIADIFKGQGAGLSVSGRIESGHVQVGESVLVLPANEIANIKVCLVKDDSVSWAVAGDQVLLTLTGVDASKITTGSVLCDPDHPARVTTKVEARVIVFNIDIPITTGFPVVLHYQSVNEPAVVKKLNSILNKTSGELIKKNPRCITKHTTAVIQLEVSRPLCLELYQECKDLGRFMLRSEGNTIAAGVVTKIL